MCLLPSYFCLCASLVGVVILVILFKAKKRKQQLLINKLQRVTTENEDIETTEIEASSSTDQPPYEETQTEAPPRYLVTGGNTWSISIKATLSIVKLNWNKLIVNMPSLQNHPDKLSY